MPRAHPRYRILKLLDEAIRRDVHFIDRHPTTFFQCMWNTCWWYDCAEAAGHYDLSKRTGTGPLPWDVEGRPLSTMLERWNGNKERSEPGFPWLRSLRPPPLHLGTAQKSVLKGHTAPVFCVAYSPDGGTLVSGSGDTTVRLWDVESSRELRVLRGHSDRVASVNFSPNGSRIASCSFDKTIRVWDAQTGQLLRVLLGHSGPVSSVSFSPDGLQIVTGSFDGTVRIWDPDLADDERIVLQALDDENGDQLQVLRGHEGSVTTVCYSPNGRHLASSSWDGSVRVWDAGNGKQLRVIRGHHGSVNSVCFSLDGVRIASGSEDRTVRVWDSRTGEEIRVMRGHENGVCSVAFSRDGRQIVSGSEDMTVRIWDAETGGELQSLRGHQDWITSVTFSPDGLRVASGDRNSTVREWTIDESEASPVLSGHSDVVSSVSFTSDGRFIATGSGDNTVRIWDAHTGECLEVIEGARLETWGVPTNWLEAAERGGDVPALLISHAQHSVSGVIHARIQGRIDLSDLNAVARGYETVIELPWTGQVTAWYSERLMPMTTLPRGRCWAGASHRSLHLIALEGELDLGNGDRK